MADNGGPAFPRPCSVNPNGEIEFAEPGMSIRDYFAGQALVGWIKVDAVKRIVEATGVTPLDALPVLAEGCYAVADAMLCEREKVQS